MLEAKTEMHNQTLECVMDGIFQAMANQMALTKAIHTGRRVSPDEFYRSPTRKSYRSTEAIHHDGFGVMKALFVY